MLAASAVSLRQFLVMAGPRVCLQIPKILDGFQSELQTDVLRARIKVEDLTELIDTIPRFLITGKAMFRRIVGEKIYREFLAINRLCKKLDKPEIFRNIQQETHPDQPMLRKRRPEH